MFWVYRYKGFSFTAARTVHTALVLAGQQGCSQADTGHLLLALVQTAQGTAADFLRRKRVTSTALAEHTAFTRRAVRAACTAGTLPPS